MATSKPSGLPLGLADEMRKATRRVHSMSDLIIGSRLVFVLSDAQLYGQAIGAFYPVYNRLEELVREHAGAAALAPLAAAMERNGLWRTAALESDLQFLLGPDWRAKLAASKAAQRYVRHLEQAAARDPALLVPYAWSLYVVLLIGVIGQHVKKALALKDDQGAKFMFVGMPGSDRTSKRKDMRAAVDQCGERMSVEQRAAVVQETVTQFQLNNSIVLEFRAGLRAVISTAAALWHALPAWAIIAMAGASAVIAAGAVCALKAG